MQKFAKSRFLSRMPKLMGCLCLCVLWAVIMASLGKPKDKDGNRPEDVARLFVEAVQAGDFEKAATYWRKGDVANIEANSQMSFKDFCLYFFKCDSFKIESRGKDKKSHVVAFRGQENGKAKTFGLFLKRIDGQWRLLMERFIKDSGQERL